jgi:hypothetical protein
MSSAPRTEFLFEMALDIGERQELGTTSRGSRVIAPIVGGSFQGPKLKGTVLPGGADSILVRSSGVRELDVRLTLKTEVGHLIYITYRGLDDTKDYFRTTPLFETAAEDERWLNDIVAVGIGRQASKGPVYSVYALL